MRFTLLLELIIGLHSGTAFSCLLNAESPAFTFNMRHPFRCGKGKVSDKSREPGLVDRVLALHAGSRRFDSHLGAHVRTIFSNPVDQDIRTQRALGLKIVVSEWRSVIAVSLNVGGGIRLVRPAKLCMCTQNTTRTDVLRQVCAAMVLYR